MTASEFNPFTDRLSRNIRNQLSEALPEAIRKKLLYPVRQIADRYLTDQLPSVHRLYIKSRLQRYETALQVVKALETEHPVTVAVILWDLELFFEVHEILEPEWMQADGDNKLLLQALIRAAGVYINLELGYRERARKIAGKAIPVLIRNQTEMNSYLKTEKLTAALESLSPKAPKIGLGK